MDSSNLKSARFDCELKSHHDSVFNETFGKHCERNSQIMTLPISTNASIGSLISRVDESHLLSLRLLINSEFKRVTERSEIELYIPPSHYPHIIEIIFAQMLSSLDMKECEEMNVTWEELFFQTYFYASQYETTFVAVESILEKLFSNLPPHLFKAFRTQILQRMESLRAHHIKHALETKDIFCIPESCFYDLFLTLICSQKHKDMMGAIDEKITIGNQDTQQEEVLHSMDILISYVLNEKNVFRDMSENKSNVELSLSSIHFLFGSAMLTQDDKWVIPCDNSSSISFEAESCMTLFNIYTEVVLSCIYRMDDDGQSENIGFYCSKRAARWVKSVFQIFDSFSDLGKNIDGGRSIFLASILCFLFLRISSIRDEIIVNLRSRISNQYTNSLCDDNDVRVLYCWMLLLISRNMMNKGRLQHLDDTNISCLKPLCDLLRDANEPKVPQRITSSVIRILSILPFGRERVLSFTRITLGVPSTIGRKYLSRGVDQSIIIALDGLLTLIKSAISHNA